MPRSTPAPIDGSAAQRWPGFAGGLLAAAAVALSAYAAHAAAGAAQAALQSAAAIAFGHGLALAALAHSARRRMASLALLAMLVGTLLFSGGLVVAHLAGLAARTAPVGGSLLIVAWLVWAVDALRR